MLGIVASICVTFFEAVCVVVFFDTFFMWKRDKHPYREFFLMVLMVTVCTFVIGFIFSGKMSIKLSFIKALLFVVPCVPLGLYFYRKSFPSIIVSSFIIFFATNVTDFVGLSITDWVSGRDNALYTSENPVIRASLGISYKIGLFFMLMVIRIICKKMRLGKYRAEPVKLTSRWVLFLALPALSMATVITLVNVAEPRYSSAVAWISLGWLVMTIVFFILLQIFDEKEIEENEIHATRNRTEAELECLWTVSQIQEDHHDYQHHLMWIEQLLAEGKSEQAYNYIKSAPHINIVTQPRIHTNNEIVDAIVNQKYWKAKAKEICIQPIMNDIPVLPIDDHDLVAILANLLDNAIEACDKVAEGRIILLKMIFDGDKLIISVKNPVNEEPVIIEDHVVTSKEDKQHHGFGLRSVQRALERNNAAYGFECKNKYFRYSAVIPMMMTA